MIWRLHLRISAGWQSENEETETSWNLNFLPRHNLWNWRTRVPSRIICHNSCIHLPQVRWDPTGLNNSNKIPPFEGVFNGGIHRGWAGLAAGQVLVRSPRSPSPSRSSLSSSISPTSFIPILSLSISLSIPTPTPVSTYVYIYLSHLCLYQYHLYHSYLCLYSFYIYFISVSIYNIYSPYTHNFSHIFSDFIQLAFPAHTGFRRTETISESFSSASRGAHEHARRACGVYCNNALKSVWLSRRSKRLFQTVSCCSRLRTSSPGLIPYVKDPTLWDNLKINLSQCWEFTAFGH